jgi:hypothetical protein
MGRAGMTTHHTETRATDPAPGMLAEYSALRTQITEADKTCVTILNVLLVTSVGLTGFALERRSAEIAWLILPIWLVGHMYLAEKRSIIMKTADYLRTNVETTIPGISWETWHSEHQDDFLRYYPFELECALAAGIAVSVLGMVFYLQDGEVFGEPWLSLATVVALTLAYVIRRSWRGWNQSRRAAAERSPPGVPPPAH